MSSMHHRLIAAGRSNWLQLAVMTALAAWLTFSLTVQAAPPQNIPPQPPTKGSVKATNIIASVGSNVKGATTSATFTMTFDATLPGDGMIQIMSSMGNNSGQGGKPYFVLKNGTVSSNYGLTVESQQGPSDDPFADGRITLRVPQKGSVPAGNVTFTLNGIQNPDMSGGYYFMMNIFSPNDPPLQEGQQPATYYSSALLIGTISIQGVVTTPDGKPVAQAWVNADNYQEGKYGGSSTNQNGEFYIADLSKGTYTLAVFGSSENTDLKDLIPPDPKEVNYDGANVVVQNLQFQKAASTIVVKVVYKGTTTPVTDFQANAFKGQGGGSFCNGDSTGQCSILVGNGSYDVMISAPWDEKSGSQKDVDWSYSEPPKKVEVNNSTATVTFEVEKATATIKGNVETTAGACPSNAQQFFIDIRAKEGKGSGGPVKPDCTFSRPTPPGKYQVMLFTGDGSSYYTDPVDVEVKDGETITIKLVLKERKAKICGAVKDKNGTAIASQRMNAWMVDKVGGGGGQFTNSTTGTDGTYCVNVSVGEWEVMPDNYNSTYIYSGPPARVQITTEDQTVTGKDFTMEKANIQITCNVVDENGKRVTNIWGWCYLRNTSAHNEYGAGLGNGQNAIIQAVADAAGTKFEMGVWVDPNFGYLPGPTRELTFKAGDTSTENVSILATDATIAGKVVDDATGNTITDAQGFVFGMSENNFTHLGTFIQNGEYSMPVRSGDRYMLGVDLHNSAGYLSGGGPDGTILSVEKGQTTFHSFRLKKSTRTLRARLLDPSGNIIPFGFVGCENWQYVENTGSADKKNQVFLEGRSEGDGIAVIPAIDGKFDCSAFAGDPGRGGSDYIPPDFFAVNETGDQNFDLKFKKSDGFLSGTVRDPNGNPVQFGFVFAWSPNGGNSGTDAFGGTYKLPLSKGTWNVGANSMDTERKFYRTEEVTIEFTGDKTMDIQLQEATGREIPDSVTFSVDVTNAVTLAPDDFTSLIIPANALGTSGTATCTFSPNIQVPAQAGSHPFESFAWDIDCSLNGVSVTTLNSNATLRLCWDEDNANEEGVDEDTIIAETYNEEQGTWQTTNSTKNEDTNCSDIVLSGFSTYSNNSTEGGTVQQAVTAKATNTHKDIVVTPLSKGGPQVAIWNESGKLVKSWMAYDPKFRLGIDVKVADIDGDGEDEVLTVPGMGYDPEIRIFSTSGVLEKKFNAYPKFRGGISWDIYDVDDDGDLEIITVPAENGTAHVKTFDPNGNLERSFMGYSSNFKGGALVIASDMEGDGLGEIILAPRDRSGQIRTFNYQGKAIAQFNAYGKTYNRGIATLTASDLEGDGLNEFIVTPRLGGSMVKIFTKDGHVVSQFNAYDKKFTGGARAYIGDVDNDGTTEIITLPNSDSSAHVKIFTKDGKLEKQFFAYPEKTTRRGRFSMTIGDFNDDGDVEMAFGTGAELGPLVRIINASGQVQSQFMALHKNFRGGINLNVVEAAE